MNNQRVIPVDRITSDSRFLQEVVTVLTEGRLIVAPTETRYGLLARADDPAVLERLFRVKGRSGGAPVAVFVHDVTVLSEYGRMTPLSETLAKKFLPGPLTLVLRAVTEKTLSVAHEGFLGFRVSSSEMLNRLVGACDFPLSATSANKSGEPDAETIDEIMQIFGNEVSIYLDGGRLLGPVSIVVKCDGSRMEILREGAVSRRAIEQALEAGR